jgi:hypothetical protein
VRPGEDLPFDDNFGAGRDLVIGGAAERDPIRFSDETAKYGLGR